MSIEKNLKKKEEVKLFQSRIESNLYERLLAKLKRKSVQHRNFLEAAAKAYLEEK